MKKSKNGEDKNTFCGIHRHTLALKSNNCQIKLSYHAIIREKEFDHCMEQFFNVLDSYLIVISCFYVVFFFILLAMWKQFDTCDVKNSNNGLSERNIKAYHVPKYFLKMS